MQTFAKLDFWWNLPSFIVMFVSILLEWSKVTFSFYHGATVRNSVWGFQCVFLNNFLFPNYSITSFYQAHHYQFNSLISYMVAFYTQSISMDRKPDCETSFMWMPSSYMHPSVLSTSRVNHFAVYFWHNILKYYCIFTKFTS